MSTSIDLIDPTASVDLALDVAEYFDLDTLQAENVLNEVRSTTTTWRDEAKRLGIKKAEIDRMASAFM